MIEHRQRAEQMKVEQCEHEDESMIKKKAKTEVETKKRKTQMKVEQCEHEDETKKSEDEKRARRPGPCGAPLGASPPGSLGSAGPTRSWRR